MRLLRRLQQLEAPTGAAAALAKLACLFCGAPASRKTDAGAPLCDACEVPPWACFHSGWFVGSRFEQRIDAGQLAPGEYIAADILIDDPDAHVLNANWDGTPRDLGPKLKDHPTYAVRERITRDPQDLGWVLDTRDGCSVGRVVEIDGDRIDWRFERGWSWERIGYQQSRPRTATPEEIAEAEAAIAALDAAEDERARQARQAPPTSPLFDPTER